MLASVKKKKTITFFFFFLSILIWHQITNRSSSDEGTFSSLFALWFHLPFSIFLPFLVRQSHKRSSSQTDTINVTNDEEVSTQTPTIIHAPDKKKNQGVINNMDRVRWFGLFFLILYESQSTNNSAPRGCAISNRYCFWINLKP